MRCGVGVYIRARPSQVSRADGAVKRHKSSPVHRLMTDHGGTRSLLGGKLRRDCGSPCCFFVVVLLFYSG